MSETAIAVGIQILGVTIASCSQLFLKDSAVRKYDKWWKQFANWRLIVSYIIIFSSMLCTSFSLKVLPLSMTPIWNAYAQILVFILSMCVLKEKVSGRSILGLIMIVIGIIVFNL